MEQAVIAKAGEAVQAGLTAAARELRPGQSIRQAIAAIDKAVRYAGAEDVRLLIATGQGSLRPRRNATTRR